MNYLVLVLVLLSQASCRQETPPASIAPDSPNAGNLPPGWKTYEDDWFRLNHPGDSDVSGPKDGKQDPKFPTFAAIPRSSDPGGGFGAFTLQFEFRTKGMLLRDAIQTEISAQTKDGGALIMPAREVKVGNGRCLTALASQPIDRCPKDQGSCHSASILTLCEDSTGRRYRANSILSLSSNPKQLSAQAQQEAAVYERILRSLEFKKS